MTTPAPSPFAGISTGDEMDALHGISSMLTGTKMLKDNPGVVYALQQAQATPADAQAVDQFMQGLDASRRVRIAQAAGSKIPLSSPEKAALDQMGVDYSGVEFTRQDQVNAAANRIAAQSNGALGAKTNPDGSYVVDKNGDIETTPSVEQPSLLGAVIAKKLPAYGLAALHEQQKNAPQGGGGFFGFIGNVAHDINNDVVKPVGRDVVKPAANALSKPLNLVEHIANADPTRPSLTDPTASDWAQKAISQSQDMQDQGYNPGSFWSVLAFDSSGKAHTDLTPLENQWDETHPNGLFGMDGNTAINEAVKYNNDPEGYQKSIENDPTNFQTVNGQLQMTTAGAEKLRMLNSPEWVALSREVGAKTDNVGNAIARVLAATPLAKDPSVQRFTDPVDHPGAYATYTAGVNLSAAFAIDPLVVAGSAAKAAKLSQVGLDSLADSTGAVRALDPTVKGIFAGRVRNGWQRAIDLSGQIRQASEAGDAVTERALTARFSAELPELSHVLPDFLGTKTVTGWTERDGMSVPIFEHTDGIRSLDDAAAYVGSKWGMTRLMYGRAPVQSSVMPGALSAFGYRRLKGAMADFMTARSAERAIGAQAEAADRLAADPEMAQRWLDDGLLVKFEPQADDAIDPMTDSVIADKGFHDLHGDVQRALSGVRAARARDALAEHGQLSAQLDDLENRLQELASSGSATPEALADLRDQIQTSRQLLDANETNNAYNVGFLKAVEAEHANLSAQINAPQAGLEVANPQVDKAAIGPVNEALQPEVGYRLTAKGKGAVAYNLRKSGSVLDDRGVLGWASPRAVAARSRLAAQRFSTLLPRNTMIGIDDPDAGDKLFRFAMLYLNRGDANAIRAAWNVGDGSQRKEIISGILDQIAEAAGITRSQTGRDWLAQQRTAIQEYSSIGDGVTKDGQEFALHPGQIRRTWVLPTFQRVQRNSRRLGLWEATFGRALTSRSADALMSQWKMLMLAVPKTVSRNMLEGWGKAALEGEFGHAVQTKALLATTNRELWEFGAESDKIRELSAGTKAEYERLLADGNAKEAERVAKASMLSGQTLGRMGLTTRLAQLAPLALVGRAYRILFATPMDDAEAEEILALGQDELAQIMHEQGQQMREAALGTRRAARESDEIAKAGYGPATLARAVNDSRKESEGAGKTVQWTQHDTDGTVGADRYVDALAQRVNPTPSVARAIIDHLRDPENHSVDTVVDAMNDPKVADHARLLGWGRKVWDDPSGSGDFRDARSAADVLNGNRTWAQKMVNDYRHLLTGQNGRFQEKLADEIYRTGRAPASEWVRKNLRGDNRPESVLAPETIPMLQGGVANAAQTLQDWEGGAFEWLVERQLLRTTSAPITMAQYAKAKVGLRPFVDDMVENHGISRAAAEATAKELAIKQAWIRAEQLIDDPGQKTQFDVIARNMFPFARATQAMIRRWGAGLWQNPVAARRMMLAYEGAVHSGMIYTNAYGEPTFTYPGSGALNFAMRELAKVPGFERLNYFPISSTMTGGALMAVPGADNPFRMSMGPMLSIPMREIFNLFPDHRAMLDEVDSFINGPIGVGETFSQLVPSTVSRFYGAMNEDDRNSALASSMVGAIANLAAAGKLPPADAPPSVREQFFTNLKAQVRSQLFLRAVLGMFAPAAPSSPTEATDASGTDYAFQMRGLSQLSDEYKAILNDTNGDTGRANAVWAALHPDKLVYEQPKTQATVTGSYLPATDNALNWMEANDGFIKKYQSVAAYFLPENTGKGAFNDRAYNTQIELGLRQRKTPEEFYDQLRVRNAEAVFYPAVAAFDKKIADAKAAGDADTARQWTNAKSGWERQFKAQNPLFGEKIDAYPDARAVATGQLADLKRMLADGDVPGDNAKLLGQLVRNYDNYDTFIHEHNGEDAQDRAIRAAALKMFNDWAAKNVVGSDLADLYSGVFRTLNTNLVAAPYNSGS